MRTGKMLFVALFSLIVCMPVVFVAADTVSGTLTVDGKPVALTGVYASYQADPFDEAKENLVVTFADVPLTAELMGNPMDLSDMAAAGKIRLAEFTITSENKVVTTKILHDAWEQGGIMSSGSDSQVIPVTMSPEGAKGTIERSGETFGHKWDVKAQFDVKVAESVKKKAASGTPLPAGGGEPGKAYQNYLKAMQSGDIAALRTIVIAARASDLDRPEVKEMLPLMQSMMATDIQITGGSTDGTEAWLQATGKDPSGATANGEITMKMENGAWKLVKDSWKVKTQ